MGQVASGWQVVIVCPPGCCFQLLPTACMCLWLPRCFVCLTVCPLKLACGASIFSFKHQQRPAAFTADVRTDNAVIRPGGGINVWPRRQKRQTYKAQRAGFLWRCLCFSVSWTQTFGSGESVRHVDAKSTCTGNPEMTSHLATAILQSN